MRRSVLLQVSNHFSGWNRLFQQYKIKIPLKIFINGRIALKLLFFTISSLIWGLNPNNQSIWLGHVRSWWILTIQEPSYVRFDHFLGISALGRLHCALERLYCGSTRFYCALRRLHCGVRRLYCGVRRFYCALRKFYCALRKFYCALRKFYCALARKLCTKNSCFSLWNI